MKKESRYTIKKISLDTFLFVGLFLLSLSVFAVVAHEVVGENEDGFDTRVFTFLKGYSSPAFIRFFRLLTFFGSVLFLLFAYAVLISYLFIKRPKEDAITVAAIAITSYI